MNYKYRKGMDAVPPSPPRRKTIDEIKEKYGLVNVHRLMFNENPYGCSQKAKEAAIKSLEEPSFYPEHMDLDLREKISRKYSVSPEEILIQNGTDDIIYLVSKVFLEPGTEVLTGDIVFPSYISSAKIMGAEINAVPMKNHRFDLDEIATRVNDKTRLIILVNPNNPTGDMFTHKEQADFLSKIPNNVPVVFDEAYAEFVTDKDYPDTYAMFKNHRNIIIFKTFSKVYGMASFRIGYAIADPEIIGLLERGKTDFPVSAQSLAAATAAFDDNNFTEMVLTGNKAAKEYTYKVLEDMGISYLPTNASFILVKIGDNADNICRKLLQSGYYVQEGRRFKMNDYIRISFGTMEQMEGFFDAFREALNGN